MTSSSGNESETKNPIESEAAFYNFSEDERLDGLLKAISAEIRKYARTQIGHIKQLTRIGISLSVEKNIAKLLETIVEEAMLLARADAGTLYITDDSQKTLKFEILQNDTLGTRAGGTSGVDVTLHDVPLYIDGKPNYANVSSYAALTGKPVNIRDVYSTDQFDFTGPRNYDATTGYRSRSMLVIPMKNHENQIIGVLQLLNAKRPESGEIAVFSPESVELISCLASQAAVALTNTQLIQDLKRLFYAFIESIATAIDEKSPYTAGHINRVVELTMMIAKNINKDEEGRFQEISFNEEEMEELRLAAWMHDVGKITVPENVIDKSTKLEFIFDLIRLIETRFELIAKSLENECLQRKLALYSSGRADDCRIAALDEEFSRKRRVLREDLEFLKSCNDPGGYLDDEKTAHIHRIASRTFVNGDHEQPYLSNYELKHLLIRHGSVSEEERAIIKNHATMTLKILNQLPFTGKLARVPEYAAGHHEKLDGSGYPLGLSEKELPLQARIMAIADIFEALTARDRPYKKPMKLSEVVRIMDIMKRNRHIDPDVYDLFINSGIHRTYAKNQMKTEMIDLPDL
ncbi:MAG: GAF domain-containing protein [Desulfobacterales bacterium]|nr:GAF domain-containing protein [Desulfobacterales bacterium]